MEYSWIVENEALRPSHLDKAWKLFQFSIYSVTEWLALDRVVPEKVRSSHHAALRMVEA